jgi:heat shock protein HslJ
LVSLVTLAFNLLEFNLLLEVQPGSWRAVTGSYELNGDRLTFGRMAGTMMACPEGIDTEKAFLEALRHVNTLRMTRQHLELFDAAGNLVARFEARLMK